MCTKKTFFRKTTTKSCKVTIIFNSLARKKNTRRSQIERVTITQKKTLRRQRHLYNSSASSFLLFHTFLQTIFQCNCEAVTIGRGAKTPRPCDVLQHENSSPLAGYYLSCNTPLRKLLRYRLVAPWQLLKRVYK